MASFNIDSGFSSGFDSSTFDLSGSQFEGAFGGADAVTGGAAGSAGQSFMSPGMSTLVTGALNMATSYYEHQIADAEIDRKNAVAEQQYWRRWASESKKNYRQYEVDLRNWYRDADYVETRRQYEQKRRDLQAGYKGEVTVQATKNFERQLADIEGRYYEEEAAEIIQLDNIRTDMISKAVKKVAGGQAGRTVQAIQQQYEQQYLANLGNRTITREFRIADKERAKSVADIARQNATNQVQFYTPQPIADPVKPLAPLPVEGVPPSPESKPGNLGIDLMGHGVDMLQQYQAMQPGPPQEVKVVS